jgi:hypothetical protein
LKFGPGNRGGRTPGAKNKLDGFAYSLVLAHVQHKPGDPAPEAYAGTNLWAALNITLKQSPRDYVTKIIAMLPKQLQIETSAIDAMTEEEAEQLIESYAAELRLREQPAPLQVEYKEVNHVEAPAPTPHK